MASVHAVADYILGKVVAEEGASITNSRLQKVVYLCQARNLAAFGEPLVDEHVKPWIYGPTVLGLEMRFRDYGDFPIDPSDIRTDPSAGALGPRPRPDRRAVGELWGDDRFAAAQSRLPGGSVALMKPPVSRERCLRPASTTGGPA